MFFLGLLSILSAALIPGLTVVSWWSRDAPVAPRLFAAFFISLSWTYAKTMFLVGTGLFTQPVLFIIFSLELSLLVYGVYLQRSAIYESPTPSTSLKVITMLKAAIAITLLILSIRFVANTTLLGPRPFWSVWTHWDSIVSWNRWALNLADGKMPTATWGYGQFIPSLWAYTYIFIGTTTVEIFAKMLSDMFPAAIVLMQIDIIFRKGIVTGIFGWLALAFFSQTHPAMWTFHPMADIPLASAVFASVYFALVSESLPAGSAKLAWFACLLTTGIAAAIKQQGLMLLLLGPFIFRPFFPKSSHKQAILIKYWTISLALGVFWYIYFLALSIKGVDKTNLANLLSITGKTGASDSLYSRLSQGLDIWVSFFGQWTVYIAIPVTLALSMYFIYNLRRFIGLFLIPYFFIWAAGFSYDIRNALLLFPLLCLLFGIVVSRSFETPFLRILRKRPKAKNLEDRMLNCTVNLPVAVTPRAALATLLVGIGSSSACFGLSISDAELKSAQEEMSWDKGLRSINIRLLELQKNNIIDKVAVTNYEVLCYMDRFRDWQPLFRFLKDPQEIDRLLNDPKIQSFIIWKQSVADLPKLYDLANRNFKIAEDSLELLVLLRK